MKEKPSDPLVEEVRARGTAYTARFSHDPTRILEDLRKHERQNATRYVSQATVVRERTPGRPE